MEEFKDLCEQKHGKSYDYSKSVYVSNKEKLETICPVHKSFWQSPSKHLDRLQGCPTCATIERNKLKVEEAGKLVVDKFNRVHGGRYNYSLVKYSGAKNTVSIICNVHGVFSQTVNDHMSGKGCQECGIEQRSISSRKSQEGFLAKCADVHGDKYDYSESVYETSTSLVKIRCKDHGIFEQSAIAHAVGKGCRKCMKTGYQISKPGFLYVLISEDTTKVGITNNAVATRAKTISTSAGRKFEILFYIKFKDGHIPNKIEARLLKELITEYPQSREVHDGFTECFLKVDRDKLLHRISQLCAEEFLNTEIKEYYGNIESH